MDICIPELVCPEDYDCKSAKLEASLSWLLSKAGVNWRNESGVCTDECSSLLTPSVINGLASGLFYFKAMCTIFPKDIKSFDQSHLSIVRWLLRQGFEVLPEEINFDILKKTDLFDQDMHITLIDKIMAAFIYQTLSVENVVKAVRRFSTFSASSELPSTIEETIVFWSNKVSQTVCEKYQSFLVPESNSEFKNHSFYDCLIVNELEDFAWGRSLACLLSFYRPDKMIFEDICLDENSGIADSLYNLQLCAEVCSQIFDFPTSASQAQLLHLTVTDVFYAHVHLTVNLMTFFADLFECFELSNSLFDENSKVGGHEVLPIKLPKISDATKRSFYGNVVKDENVKVLPSSRASSLLPLRRDINQKEETNDEKVTKFGPLSDHCLIRKAICIDANEITKDRIHKAQNHQDSDTEEIVSTRDASSIDLSSSSREIVGNRIPIPCSTSSSCSSREAFVHYNHSKSHCFERPHNAQETPNIGHYQSRPSHSLSSTNDSDSQKLTFSTPNSKHTNCDPITKLKTNACDSMLQNDRHIRYCHDLGLISGISKFRRQSGNGVPKLALSSHYPSDGNLNNYHTMTDGDDEVISITGEAADDEEFATPPEEFGQRHDNYAGKDYFNNSNSNLSKANGAFSKEVSYRKNFLESNNGASNRSLKTSWLRQKKLASPEDEAAVGLRPTKKEAQRNGTFRVVKGYRDEVTDFEEKTKNLCSSSTTYTMSSLPKTSFSLLKQKHPKSKKAQDLTNAPTISQPKSNLTLGKTTWVNSMAGGNASITKDNDNLDSPSSSMSSKMGFLKMELIEKRRQIEGKKLSSDILWSKQRQQVGTEAFMQVVKGHKNIKSCDKDLDHAMERIVESLSPDKDVPVLQNFEQAFDSNAAESLPRDNLSEYEKYNIKGVVNNYPDLYSSKEKDVSVKNEFSVINQNEGLQNKEVTQVFENNLDTVRTIDHLTHSLSELKGEVKRLSLEQDQLKGFVSVSQTPPVTKNNKKLRQTQTQQKDILSHLQRTKPYSSPIKVPDLVPYENCYSKPQFDNESLQHQPKPTTHISTATKSLSYQHMPSHAYSSQLISEARPVGGAGSSCTPPMYSVYTTLPNKRAHRPLSSDGRFIQVPEYLPPSELAYEYPGDVLGSYQHPLMTLPHPYAPPHSSSHIAYQFPLRDHVGSVNIMRHHPSSIAFTIPNDPPNLLQHNVLSDWPSTSYHGNYPSTYQIGDKVPPGFVPGVAPVASFASDLNSMHFPDPNQVIVTLNSNHPQSPQFTPINFRQKSFDVINEPASVRATPEQSKQAMFTNLSEVENRLDGGHTFPEQKVDAKERKCTEPHPQHDEDKAFLTQEDVTDFENQPSNKSDNNALRSPVETLNGNGESSDADEMKLWKAAEEEIEALAQSSGAEEKRKTIKENPVAFVVRQSSNENINIDELEKRKQKLEEMHAKRREEQEMKRLKLERDALIKKELQRQREEQALQKRAEDRARREAIYQTYMQKKLEGFGEEETGSKGEHSAVPRAVSSHPQVVPSSATKRQKSARTTRRAGTPSTDEKIKEQHFSGVNASPLPHSQEAQTPLVKVSTTSNASSEEKESAKEYTGPKLFVKPCHKSNRNIIENAISHCCLAGVVNQETKAKVLEVLKNSESKHFVILFRDVGMQYRGLYTYDLEEETITKIQGVGPKALTNKHIEKFFKYNSGSKNFSEVSSTKHLSATIDAITLYGAVWQRLKASALAGSKRNLT